MKRIDKRAKVHIAGPKQDVQRCIRCHARINDARWPRCTWAEGAAVASFGHASMSAISAEEAQNAGRYRPCGKQA